MTLSPLQQYGVVTANYWAFTLTDGALRMLVVFHFHALGYSTLEIAGLFLFYEFFGVVTNLTGGWIGARYGLRLTLWIGTLLQIAALLMLIPVSAAWPKLFSVIYVMAAQAISGIAKDLNKMSAKSAIKTVVPDSDAASGGDQRLFRWVAILTGSKNALKGVGFFLGGVLLTALGFKRGGGLDGGWSGPRFSAHAGAAGRDRPGCAPSPVSLHCSPNPRDQCALTGQVLPVRSPRCLVCGCPSGVPVHATARMELLGGRWLPRALDDRLRHRSGRHRGCGVSGGSPAIPDQRPFSSGLRF